MPPYFGMDVPGGVDVPLLAADADESSLATCTPGLEEVEAGADEDADGGGDGSLPPPALWPDPISGVALAAVVRTLDTCGPGSTLGEGKADEAAELADVRMGKGVADI